MGFAKGKPEIVNRKDLLNRVSEREIIAFYLGVTTIPTVINSPLRIDKNPSFVLFGESRIFFKDLSTKQVGGLYDLLSEMWGLDYRDVLIKINKDFPNFTNNVNTQLVKTTYGKNYKYSESVLECKIRNWEQHDVEYWNQFGISIKWLNYADVYPISHKIIIKNNNRIVLGADKYAYAYVERKENNITLKIYQPFNQYGYKWSSKHNSSVISLWTKIPKTGDKICICSSLKDALCLWINTDIPSIAVQGEGYNISNTVINELKTRYKNVYILFDNDVAGVNNSNKLADVTGFKNIQLPYINSAKDISDLYKSLNNKNEFKNLIINLFKN